MSTLLAARNLGRRAVGIEANERYVDGVFDANRCRLIFKVDGEELFRRIGAIHPEAIEKIGMAAMVRRAGLDEMKAAAQTTTVEATTFMTRMKKFLRLGQ